jgi:hypothetical protein
MKDQAPVLDVFIGRAGDAWKLYSAPLSWRTPFLPYMDARGDIYPVRQPDLEDLERFMWESDSPYGPRPTSDGGLQIVARGRSAVTLAVWLQELIRLGDPT